LSTPELKKKDFFEIHPHWMKSESPAGKNNKINFRFNGKR